MRNIPNVMGSVVAAMLLVPPAVHAQASAQQNHNGAPTQIMSVLPACPVSSPSEGGTKNLEINYFPSHPGAAIKDPHSLILRLVFDNPYRPDREQTIPFERQSDGDWKANVPFGPHSYAIWYVRDDATGERDDHQGQYWDLVFCDTAGKKLISGIRVQAQSYTAVPFSNDIKRKADYDHAIAVLENNTDPANLRDASLVSQEWFFKMRRQGSDGSAISALTRELEKGLSEHSGQAGYIQGTASFLVNQERLFPKRLVDNAAALADHMTHSKLVGTLARERAQRIKDPKERAQAFADWLESYPDDPFSNSVRKQLLQLYGSVLGDPAAAEGSFKELENRTPSDPDLYATMASIYIDAPGSGKPAHLHQALVLLDKAEADLDAPVGKGVTYLATLSLEGKDQNRAILNFWRGNALAELHRLPEAEAALEKAAPVLDDRERAGLAYVLLGRTQEQLQHWAQARESYLQAAVRSPENTNKFVEAALKAGAPSRQAALKELDGARARNFEAAHYQPAIVDLPAPDFIFTTVNGKPITAASLRGKTVVVDFWATWCAPCLLELPGFARLKHAHPEVRVLLVAMDSTVAEAEKDLRKNGFSTDDLILVDDSNFAKFGPVSVPQTYVFDKNGRIRIVHLEEVPDVPRYIGSDLAALAGVAAD